MGRTYTYFHFTGEEAVQRVKDQAARRVIPASKKKDKANPKALCNELWKQWS